MAGKGKIAGGILLLILGIILSGISYSISNQCNTFSGQFGSLMDSQRQEICMVGSFLVIVGIFMAIIGLVLIIVGAISKDKNVNQQGNKIDHQIDKNTIFCRYCGKARVLSDNYCGSCGRSAQSSSNSLKQCECGSDMTEDSIFCSICGRRFPDNRTNNTNVLQEEKVDDPSNNKHLSDQVDHGEVVEDDDYVTSNGKISKKTIWIIIGAVVGTIGVGVLLYSFSTGFFQAQQYTETTESYYQPTPAPAQPYKEVIVQDSITLEGGQGRYYEFSTPNAVDVRLSGTIGVTGGIIEHVAVYLMDVNQCAPPSGSYLDFTSCNSYYINREYYTDGSSVNMYLPSGGTFYLAFLNDAVLGESKIIEASFNVEARIN